MSTIGVDLDGTAQLIATLGDAGEQIEDVDAVGQGAAREILGAARPPRKSGRLAASLAVVGFPGGAGLTGTVPYFGPIHWGWPARHIRPNPFFVDALNAREAAIVGDYVNHVDQAVDQIRGA